MTFTLKEPTLVRFTGLVHKHLDFDLELSRKSISETTNKQVWKKMVSSSSKELSDTLYMQLEEGDYRMKVLFDANPELLNLPCQTIDLSIAMKKMSDLDKQLSIPVSQSIDYKS